MNADEIEKADEIVRNLRECEHVGYETQRQMGLAASDLIENLTSQLADSQRMETAAAELMRKIYFATDEDLCDCCRKIVCILEAWWHDDEKGEAE